MRVLPVTSCCHEAPNILLGLLIAPNQEGATAHVACARVASHCLQRVFCYADRCTMIEGQTMILNLRTNSLQQLLQTVSLQTWWIATDPVMSHAALDMGAAVARPRLHENTLWGRLCHSNHVKTREALSPPQRAARWQRAVWARRSSSFQPHQGKKNLPARHFNFWQSKTLQKARQEGSSSISVPIDG